MRHSCLYTIDFEFAQHIEILYMYMPAKVKLENGFIFTLSNAK